MLFEIYDLNEAEIETVSGGSDGSGYDIWDHIGRWPWWDREKPEEFG